MEISFFLLLRPNPWSLSDVQINSMPGILATARCLPRPSPFGPFGHFSTQLTSRNVLPCQGFRSTALAPRSTPLSTRNQAEAKASKYHTFQWGQAREILNIRSAPPLRLPDGYTVQRNVFGSQEQPGSLTMVPERWDTAEVPSRQKIPVSCARLCSCTYSAGAKHTTRTGPSEVGSSQEKPACMRRKPNVVVSYPG